MPINRTRTDKQIAASRTNGKKSKGPTTPEGQYNSAFHRTGHSILARTVVLNGESTERFIRLADSLFAELLPDSPIENQLVESIAVARWRPMRFWALEKATIVGELAKSEPLGKSADVPRAMALFHKHRAWRREEIKNARTNLTLD